MLVALEVRDVDFVLVVLEVFVVVLLVLEVRVLVLVVRVVDV